MNSSWINISICIFGYAVAVTLFLGGMEYLGMDNDSGIAVVQLIIEAGLCAVICLDLLGARDFVKSNPKAFTSAWIRYNTFIGLPILIGPVVGIFAMLAVGRSDLLETDLGPMILIIFGGLVYLIAALIFGVAIPGTLKEPKDTIGIAIRRSGRQFGYLFSRFLIIMVPFGAGAFLLPLVAITSGHMSPDMILTPKSLAIIFVARILAGISILGFCMTVVSALRLDMEEEGR